MLPLKTEAPRRILMTADAVGGVWQYATDLARALRPSGIEVVLAVLGPVFGKAGASAIPRIEVIETGLPLDWTADRPDEVERAGRAIASLAAERAVDLVHLNTPALAAGGAFDVPVVAACHSCLATWWRAMRGGPLPEDFRWRVRLQAEGLSRADALVAPTAAFARATAEAYGLPGPPKTVHNGRRMQKAGASALPRDSVFTAGRLWDEGKNFSALERLAARLPVPVLAAGPLIGPNGAAVHPARVHALGPLGEAEIRAHLSARPIFVSLARYEPFGLAVLEAAQAGCALVLSDIPTFRELWDGAALFVKADDDAGAAEAVLHLRRNPAERARRGAAAAARAGRYSLESTASRMSALYAGLVAAPRAERREAAA